MNLGRRAVVAQLDRVPDYESGGRRFESSRLHQFFLPAFLIIFKFLDSFWILPGSFVSLLTLSLRQTLW